MDGLGVVLGPVDSVDESDEWTISEVDTPLSSESFSCMSWLASSVCDRATGLRGRNSATLTLSVVAASVDGDGEGGGVAGSIWLSLWYSFE